MRGRIGVCGAVGGLEGGGGWDGGYRDDVVGARGLVILGVGGHCAERLIVIGRAVINRRSSLVAKPNCCMVSSYRA